MKVVILAGGLGTRLSEYTNLIPKPMVEIGGKPILWHIMNIYASHGFNDFIIALGYKGEIIKEYFLNYAVLNSDISIEFNGSNINYINKNKIDWKVTLIDTGEASMTGGRIKRLKDIIGENTFMLTYGDAVSNINIKKLIEFHKSHGKYSTITAVHPPARFGELILDINSKVTSFKEKPQTNLGWINGGFFVFEPKIFDYIQNDTTVLEKEPLENLSLDGQLFAYCHHDFWQSMDTIRDKNLLEEIWKSNNAPWKNWF